MKKSISITIEESQYERLQKIAEMHMTNISFEIRKAIQNYIRGISDDERN